MLAEIATSLSSLTCRESDILTAYLTPRHPAPSCSLAELEENYAAPAAWVGLPGQSEDRLVGRSEERLTVGRHGEAQPFQPQGRFDR